MGTVSEVIKQVGASRPRSGKMSFKKAGLRKNVMHLKVLRRKRDNIVGSAKLIQQFNEQYDDSKIDQVAIRIERLDGLWDKFEDTEDEIEALEDHEEGFSETRQEFQNLYFDLKASLVSKLPRAVTTNSPSPGPSSSRHSVPPANQPMSVKLPEIKIPEFGGRPDEWIEFRDLFKSLVHTNPQIPAVQKLHYLRSAMKGEASRLISSFAITSDNYTLAWKTICDRYENKNFLVKQHMSAILKISHVKRESSSALAELADEFNRHVAILDKLEAPEVHWNSFLVERLSSLLDEKSLMDWEAQCNDNVVPQYQDLLNFVLKRSRTLQMCKPLQGSHPTNVQKPTRAKLSSHVASENIVKCPSCKQAHSISQCESFLKLTPNNRLDFVKKNQLCINCLRGGHLAKDCRSSLCKTCAKRHHSLLHLPPIVSASSSMDERPANTTSCTAVCSADGTITQEKSSFSVSVAPSVVPSRTPPKANSSSPQTFAVGSPSLSSSVYSNYRSEQNEPLPHCSYESSMSFTPTNKSRESTVFLSTALVRVQDADGIGHFARALLDSGSQSNFVSESMCQKLGLKRSRINLPVSGIGQATVSVRYCVQISLASRFGSFVQDIDCLVLPKLTVNLPSRHVDISKWNIPRHVPLADPKFNISHGIDMIVGAELFFSLIESHQIILADNYPVLQKTVLGYVICGKYSANTTGPVTCHVVTEQDLNTQLEKMWEVENLDVGKALTQTEQDVENHFLQTVSRDATGRYIVRLPFRESMSSLLDDSYDQAVKRFLLAEKRFARDKKLREEYTKFMDDYERLGHMEVGSRVAGPQYFLPHHAVHRPESSTTKTRIVFDASSKGSGALSLNDTLHTGPTVQPPLLTHILNFRLPRYVFTADAEKMFRQIWVHPDDRRYLKIIWRPDPSLPLQIYQLKTVTYGLACSPYHAARVLMKLAEEDGHKYPLAAAVVTKRIYVDDALAGSDCLNEATETCRQLRELLHLGGFSLRKWSSNDTRILKYIPTELWENASKMEICRSTVTALGLLWNPTGDFFEFKIPSFPELAKVTKRIVVSETAQLFDPLGLLGSIVISARIFVQRLWAKNISWDEELSTEESAWWMNFRSEMKVLQQLAVPRRVLSNSDRNYQLHCFCDASERGYGCCVYVVSQNTEGQTISQLLITKSRVAPLRGLSIPRLELCAAVLGSQLVDKLRNGTDFTGSVTFWTDSTVVLYWLRAPPADWKVFVSNRIAEVQRLSKGFQWRHVPTEHNPADKISRGIRPNQIMDDELWWHGPQYLSQPVSYWPETLPNSTPLPMTEMEFERRQIVALNCVEIDDSIFSKFSELGKLLKVVAWCLRFSTNIRKRADERIIGKLTPIDIEKALKSVIHLAQAAVFSNEIHQLTLSKMNANQNIVIDSKSPLKNLNVFLDDNGLIRLNSRLSNLEGPYDTKFPLVIPAKHRLSWLIARSLHLRTAHAGPSLLLSTMRQRYWPIQGRQLVRRIVRNCVTCFRCSPASTNQQMAPLPSVRITPARVFSKSGLDYCGPFNVRPLYGRGASVKMYIAVFVCLSVKAVHVEIVSDLSSGACINAVKRFVARRGRLIELRCDNATAFVGADREMRELRRRYMQQFQTDEWDSYCLDSGISFKFIPARSPHFGGLWEAGVKSFKRHFRRIFGNSSYTIDELTTAATHIESILNSRPLTPLTDHPGDLSVLTPGHFIIGEPMFSLPEPDVTNVTVSRLSRFQEMRRAVQNFWKCWSRDYLTLLHQRSKWRKATKNIDPGTIVLVKQDNYPPFTWPLGRIMETFVGPDGLVRVVLVRTGRGLYKRAITEVSPLPIEEEDVGGDMQAADRDHQGRLNHAGSTGPGML